jgi:hypothetical protein
MGTSRLCHLPALQHEEVSLVVPVVPITCERGTRRGVQRHSVEYNTDRLKSETRMEILPLIYLVSVWRIKYGTVASMYYSCDAVRYSQAVKSYIVL